MVRRRAEHESAPSLPPIEYRAEDFKNPSAPGFERIPTPVDALGLVDTRQLLIDVNGTLSQSYKWPSVFDDNHHLYWPARLYPDRKIKGVNGHEFRNLYRNMRDEPRSFHGWLHKVTVPPKKPRPEVMHYSIQVAGRMNRMHECIRMGKRLLRDPVISPLSADLRGNELFDEFCVALDELKQLPKEFLPIDPNVYQLRDASDMLLVSGELGKHATSQTVAVSARFIRQNTVPKSNVRAA